MESNIKLLQFQPKQKDILSEEEIMKIFVGLLRLIQKTADFNACEKVKKNIDSMKKQIEELNRELRKRTSQVEELLNLNDDLIKQINLK